MVLDKNTLVGSWKIITYLGKDKYKCICKCGIIKEVSSSNLYRAIKKNKDLKCFNCTVKDRTKNEIGQRYNNWEVLKKDLTKTNFYYCKCSCGAIKNVNIVNLRRGTSKGCRECFESNNFNNKHPGWIGHGEIPGQYWSVIKYHAKSRQLKINLTIEDAWNLFLKQNRKCALSGVELKFETRIKGKPHNQTASLDRIDSSKDYTLDNVQWVHKDVNFLKQEYSQEDFIKWCLLITKFTKRNNGKK